MLPRTVCGDRSHLAERRRQLYGMDIEFLDTRAVVIKPDLSASYNKTSDGDAWTATVS